MPITLEFPLKPISSDNRIGRAVQQNLQDSITQSFTIEAGVALSKDGKTWTTPYICKVDTGAYMTLLPFSAFNTLNPDRWTPYQLYGVVNKPEWMINCRITKINAVLHSPYGLKSPVLNIWVAFAETNDIPLLLGMLGILDTFTSTLSPEENKWTMFFP